MDLDRLEQTLLAAARAHPPSDAVPYAFAQRVMARLPGRPIEDHWAAWTRALWRAAAPCVGIMLLLGAWSLFEPESESSGDLSQDFEYAVMAAAVQDSITDPGW